MIDYEDRLANLQFLSTHAATLRGVRISLNILPVTVPILRSKVSSGIGNSVGETNAYPVFESFNPEDNQSVGYRRRLIGTSPRSMFAGRLLEMGRTKTFPSTGARTINTGLLLSFPPGLLTFTHGSLYAHHTSLGSGSGRFDILGFASSGGIKSISLTATTHSMSI